MQEKGAPDMDDISKDDRTPLEKNSKSTLYIAGIEELQEYFRGVLKTAHLGNHDTYTLLQIYWDKVPFVIIKSTVEDLLSKAEAKRKNIFTVRYFKNAVYENHKKYTHRLEPEKELMPQEQVEKKEKFHRLAGRLAKEKKHDAEKSEEVV